jgi:hypothetical protein
MTGIFGVLGSALRLKAEAISSSKGQKVFICREEKRKAAWGHGAGPRNQWFCGSGFYSLFLLPEGRDVSQVQIDVSWEGDVSPWPVITFWDLLQWSINSPPQ